MLFSHAGRSLLDDASAKRVISSDRRAGVQLVLIGYGHTTRLPHGLLYTMLLYRSPWLASID